MLFAIFLKSLKINVSMHHLILKIMNQFRCYILSRWKFFLSSVATGWQGWIWIETLTFSSFNAMHAKTIMVSAPWWNLIEIFFITCSTGAFCVWVKVPSNEFRTELTSTSNILVTWPRVVKSSRLLEKIASYLVRIDRLLCLAFLYGWCFLNKISLEWPLTLTTQSSTSKLSDDPDGPSL